MKITENLTLIAVGKLHTEIDDSQYGSMISNLRQKPYTMFQMELTKGKKCHASSPVITSKTTK